MVAPISRDPPERKLVPQYSLEQINALNKAVIEEFRSKNGTVTEQPVVDAPLLLLHHVGAKSGTERIAPLAYGLDGDDVIVIASKGGSPENPAWFYNLLAKPETTIEIGSDTIEVTAEALTEGPERERIFKQMADVYANFYEYQKNVDRLIPVVVLHRR
jgi:deazaflavin-dependent oxidoreductase (nitroreductase family)